MIHHLVMLKFKPGVETGQIKALEACLDELPNKIVEIHVYEFGRNLLPSERSYDFALSALFANLEALNRYQRHPEHRKVLEMIRRICEDAVTVDFTGSEPGAGTGGDDVWGKDPFERWLG